MLDERKYFPFYWNWAKIINDSYDDDDIEFAQQLAFAIVRYASTGEIIDLGDKRAQRMFENALTIGVDAAERHYVDGCKGGRPTKLNEFDQPIIAQMRAEGQNQTKIAKSFGVSEKTISRADGWINWQEYIRQNQTKLEDKRQNQEEKEEEKENLRLDNQIDTLITVNTDYEALTQAKTTKEQLRALGF